MDRYINIGGHKITTNKVGQMHKATYNTTDFDVTASGGVFYKVVNGICSVLITQCSGKAATVGTDKVLATNLPKCGMYMSYPVWDGSIQNCGYAFIFDGQTQIVCHPHSTTMFWCSFVYPVADDWVES